VLSARSELLGEFVVMIHPEAQPHNVPHH
jgi:hypothetical protein